uniref:Anaphase-promoting complex subunit 4 WD40 domain-containing protein n=1 Tax=Compsopogon caeruleus TaxID=31354 RepID=A0A7S1XGP0_9RHOD|mmetsp:Transcript_6496/g.13002  ORF Transcript_6496/g.13002 Transcript_6496/m.13002 type:complete len:194 (+) Transcript_6496:552-1133(+)
MVSHLCHSETLNSRRTVLFQEEFTFEDPSEGELQHHENNDPNSEHDRYWSNSGRSYYAAKSGNVSLREKENTLNTSEIQRVLLYGWSSSGRYIASLDQHFNDTVWIWNLRSSTPTAVLRHRHPVLDAQWDPFHERLAICTGQGTIFFWTPRASSCVDIPWKSFQASTLAWSPLGGILLARGRTSHLFLYVDLP